MSSRHLDEKFALEPRRFVPDEDAESNEIEELNYIGGEGKLKRQLKNRHVTMISFGGAIGTGLFVGTASALANGGPLGLLLGYALIGSITFCVMISLGEMIAYLPKPGGHIMLADRFVDPAFSFALGWNYWFNWVIVLPAELSAASILINYWNKTVNDAAWITMCLVVVILINMFGAGMYGECEFVFASIKIVTITGLIILGIIIDLGGGPNHDRIGFRYWNNPGPFVNFEGIPGAKGRFLGWWAVTIQAAFSYIGTEIVAMAAGETKNPRRNLPKAVRRVVFRILVFYIGGTFIIGLLVPSNEPRLNLKVKTAAASPFVIAISTAGIKGLPSVINACLLTSAWSAASSDLYTGSRALYGLSISGNAPKIFRRTLTNGLPFLAIITSSCFSLLAYLGVHSGSGKVFGWLTSLAANTGMLNWCGIAIIYIRWHQGLNAQAFDRRNLPYTSRLQPYAAWYAAIACAFVLFFSGWEVFLRDEWNAATFVTTYLPLVLFPILYFGAKYHTQSAIIKPIDMDFTSDIAEIDAETREEPTPMSLFERLWDWVF